MATAQDFMIGLPNRSHRIIVTKTLKPRPMKDAEPQGSACGAVISGHSRKMPVVGRLRHDPLPPAQSSKPDSIRLIPIRVTVGPVTRGGNNFLRYFGDVNDMRISSKAQQHAVPMIAPRKRQTRGSKKPIPCSHTVAVWAR